MSAVGPPNTTVASAVAPSDDYFYEYNYIYDYIYDYIYNNYYYNYYYNADQSLQAQYKSGQIRQIARTRTSSWPQRGEASIRQQ